MTMEKIDPPGEPEKAAVRAARLIKELHLEQIAKMNTGYMFTKKNEAGESVSCNDEMRAACMEQIDLCNKIIDTAQQVPEELLRPVDILLHDAHDKLNRAIATAAQEDLPEIGNYDHKTE